MTSDQEEWLALLQHNEDLRQENTRMREENEQMRKEHLGHVMELGGDYAELEAKADALAEERDRLREALLQPITWPQIRLTVGEGRLEAADTLAGVHAELRRRAALGASPVPAHGDPVLPDAQQRLKND